jgi:hypothetical protein
MRHNVLSIKSVGDALHIFVYSLLFTHLIIYFMFNFATGCKQIHVLPIINVMRTVRWLTKSKDFNQLNDDVKRSSYTDTLVHKLQYPPYHITSLRI